MSRFLPAALILLLIEAVVSQLPQNINSRGIPYPSGRFVQYKYLDDNIIAELEALGYTEATWNKLGSNPIETISFEAQGLGQIVLANVGFTQEEWDCWINHYMFFSWDELEEMNVEQYLVALGWDADCWGGYPPDIYNNYWDELTDEQQGNATEVCYFEHNWNRDNLIFWTTGPPTDSPTMVATLSPTEAPSVETNPDSIQDADAAAENEDSGAIGTRWVWILMVVACVLFGIFALRFLFKLACHGRTNQNSDPYPYHHPEAEY